MNKKLHIGLIARKSDLAVCKQRRRRSACASAQLISAFVIRLLEGIIFKAATCKI